ncbi:hypothetical protein OIU85_002273 [Salix viminalis]|uniref:Uncharacterized protein n=1 Tax=Salix viminalis TaxID=40686 RepID=A0A9Q0VNE4_SALVM|nr:hypothetical protein OIU85_002273 [Salix viminalis]
MDQVDSRPSYPQCHISHAISKNCALLVVGICWDLSSTSSFTGGTRDGGPSTPISYRLLWMLVLLSWELSFILPFNPGTSTVHPGGVLTFLTTVRWQSVLQHQGSRSRDALFSEKIEKFYVFETIRICARKLCRRFDR